MKIIFNTESLGAGGAERVISNLANYLSATNDIEIIVNSNEVFYELNKKIKINFLINGNNFFIITIEKIFRIFTMRKLLKKIKPDVIISFLPKPSFRIIIANFGLKYKIIVSERNNPEEEYKTFIKQILFNNLYSKTNGFVFQTNDQKNYFKRLKLRSITVIPNPLKEEFVEQTTKNIIKENIIINVGRLHPQKNQLLLLKAFSKIVLVHPEYKLKIFGEGPLKDELESFIKINGLIRKAIIIEPIKNIKDELLKSKIFVLCSNYEGLPNSLMEAMACGLPCISTNCPCGGPHELIENEKNGILININDEDELINKINFLIENPKKSEELGIKAGEISKKLKPQKIFKSWEKYIMEVVKSDK